MDQKPTKEELEFYRAYSRYRNKFLDHYREWADTYSHLNIRSVAIQVYDRPDILTRKKVWLNLFTSMDLSVHPIKECLERVDGCEELLFTSRTLPSDQLSQVLSDFDQGHLDLAEAIDGESKIIFAKAEHPLNCRSGPPISEGGHEWSTKLLESVGKGISETVEPKRKKAIDSKFPASSTPYDHLDDFLTKKTSMRGNCTGMRIIAPIFLQFEEEPRPKIKNKTLAFSILGHKALRNLRVTYILDGEEERIPKPRGDMTFDMDDGDPLNDEFFRVTKTVDCGEATKATMRIIRGNTLVDHTWAERLSLTMAKGKPDKPKPPKPSKPGENAQSNTCFVIMPFGEPFDAYYKEILVPAIRKVRLVPIRADKINKPGVIIDQIWRGIKQAKVCVADVTGRNANVMYELGLSHAAEKPVVQIIQNIDDLPFDLRAYRHIVYETKSPRWANSLRTRLQAMLTETIADRDSALVFPKSYSGKFGAKSQKEVGESAILMAVGPDKASQRMKKILVTAYRSYTRLDRSSEQDRIEAIIAQEVDRVRMEAEENSIPDDERKFERNMAKIVAGRIDSMRTEFLALAFQNPDKPVLKCLGDAIERWSPSPAAEERLKEMRMQYGAIELEYETIRQRARPLLEKGSYANNVFIMMPLRPVLDGDERYIALVRRIKDSLRKEDLEGWVATDKQLAPTLWENVVSYMEACAYGIGIFTRLEKEGQILQDYNPNVSLEIGFMLSRAKKVLILKDIALERMTTDLIGRLYEEFDLNKPRQINSKVRKWAKAIMEEKPNQAKGEQTGKKKRTEG